MATDLDGNLYCAGLGGVLVFDKQGRHLGTIAVPETPAALTWGDDYKTLFIPAQTSLYRVALKVNGTRIH
jgi:gluconolactonase